MPITVENSLPLDSFCSDLGEPKPARASLNSPSDIIIPGFRYTLAFNSEARSTACCKPSPQPSDLQSYAFWPWVARWFAHYAAQWQAPAQPSKLRRRRDRGSAPSPPSFASIATTTRARLATRLPCCCKLSPCLKSPDTKCKPCVWSRTHFLTTFPASP